MFQIAAYLYFMLINPCVLDTWLLLYQVDAAREKGWTVQSLFEGEWLEYDGEDPESVASIPSEKADGPWYDLQGRRLEKPDTPSFLVSQNRGFEGASSAWLWV